jgi:hypothetical protein
VELEIDLYDYPGRNITIEKTLKRESALESRRELIPDKPADSKPVPRKEPVKEPAEEVPPQISMEEPAIVTLKISPEDASIYFNDKFWGIVPKGGKIENLRLKPGKYNIQIVKPGYKYYEKTVTLEKGQKLDLEINLTGQ